jgi:hypothetical protein
MLHYFFSRKDLSLRLHEFASKKYSSHEHLQVLPPKSVIEKRTSSFTMALCYVAPSFKSPETFGMKSTYRVTLH